MMRCFLILISISSLVVNYNCDANVDSSHCSYRYKSAENVFEVYKINKHGEYKLIELIKLENKKGRTFFVSGTDTIYTILAKNDVKINPPIILEDSLNSYDFDTPYERGFIDVTFICRIDKDGKIASNAVIHPGSSFIDLDSKLLKRLKDIPLHWEPAQIKGKKVNAIIIGKYNFITSNLKWQ